MRLFVLEIFNAGGWLMWPILVCSILAMTIILERAWMLRRNRVAPSSLMPQVLDWINSQQIDTNYIEKLSYHSPLGKILAAGLTQRYSGRDTMKETIEDTGRHVVAELERFLHTLGTIAEVAPLLGLLGTVFGMIQTFNTVSAHGVGNPTEMAGGIAVALITTAFGLTVAIPALIGHRYFQAKIDTLVITMEKDALHLIEIIHHNISNN